MVDLLAVSIATNEHDSSVAIADATRVLAVVEAERFTRLKHKWCSANEIGPLVEAALALVKRRASDVTHWCGTAMGNTLFPPNERRCEFAEMRQTKILGRKVDFWVINHHLAHAAGAFLVSPFDDALVDACDAGGDGRRHVQFRARRNRDGVSIEDLPSGQTRRFNGTFYDVCSYYLFKRYMQEGKFMGLAAFGTAADKDYEWLREHAEALSTLTHELSYQLLHKRFSLDAFDWRDERCQAFAAAVQAVFVDERVRQVQDVASPTDNIVLCGGTALNIHANSALGTVRVPGSVFVPPCCDDSGQALGALLYVVNVLLGTSTAAELPFLGIGQYHESDELHEDVAYRLVDDLLADKVVAWHWGRAEVGPRALGHRSLLSSPRDPEQRVLLSERIKGREPYRPVAPIVLAEHQHVWFEHNGPSPYMLFAGVATDRCLTFAPAVVHADKSARLQTIDDGHVLAKAIRLFHEATGVPVLINSSLNGPGQPIAQTHDDTLAFCQGKELVVPYLEGVRIAM